MQHGTWARVIPGGMIVLLLMQPHGYAAKASVKPKHRATTVIGKHVTEKKPESVQIVSFLDTEWHAVRIIRGGTSAKDQTTGVEPAEKAESRRDRHVRRSKQQTRQSGARRYGPCGGDAGAAADRERDDTELVTFVNLRDRPVTVLRGSIAQSLPGIELFRPASESDLDRVAFAVDGAESSHGTDLRMWRPELNGPQGPMQVSAAAAIDIGGGDRFDIAENRQLGRAYLARMYRRFGNWSDAIAAYNWGPGNMDAWIGSGRPASIFPFEVERYRDRVLHDAGFDETSRNPLFYDTRQLPEVASPSARQYPTVVTSTRHVAK